MINPREEYDAGHEEGERDRLSRTCGPTGNEEHSVYWLEGYQDARDRLYHPPASGSRVDRDLDE